MTPFLSRPKRLPCSNQKGKSKMAPSVAGSGFLKIFVLFGILLTVQAQGDLPNYDADLMLQYGTLQDIHNPPSFKLPFNITYFGSSYAEVFVSKDGLIGLSQKAKYMENIIWSEGDFVEAVDEPFMAPFYYDGFEIFTGNNIGDLYAQKYERTTDATDENNVLFTYMDEYIPTAVVNAPSFFKSEIIIVVTWDQVTSKKACDSNWPEEKRNECPRATFQAVIVADRSNTFAIFNYKQMDIPFDRTYQAGFNGGQRRGWFNVIPCQEKCAERLKKSRINDLPNLKGSDKVGRFILDVGHETIARGGCLPNELVGGTLEVYPHEIGMFGGEYMEVSGRCLPYTSSLQSTFKCKFSSYQGEGKPERLFIETKGYMMSEMIGKCEVPSLEWKGPTLVSWSTDGVTWTAQRTITVVLPSQVPLPYTPTAEMVKAWNSRNAQQLTVGWDPSAFSRLREARVKVKLVGYKEDNKRGYYHSLHEFGEMGNSGTYTFDVESHRCTENCLEYEQGLLEVRLLPEYHPTARHRVAFRYGPIPIGWFVDQQLTESMGQDWSDQMCLKWEQQDSQNLTWLSHLLPCPCNLDQALADFGRFQVDPGCNLFKGSKCTYHIGAKHCVRSVQPTPEGAGNQCCYNDDGTLRYSQLSYQGSTPDRGHVWGSRPYGVSNRVPSLSHWKHDVVSFYYCCLWNEYRLCDHYMKHRPTADCKRYELPGIGFIRGDPHITTFDGQNYHFGGRGDYYLVKASGLNIQGRFEKPLDAHTPQYTNPNAQRGSSRLSQVAIRADGVPDVRIKTAPRGAVHSRGLDVYIEEERIFFLTAIAMVQEFGGGLTVVNNAPDAERNNAHNNFTVLLPNNVGLIVVNNDGLLQVTVSLPPTMKSTNGMGLLGNFDNKPENDFQTFTNQLVPATSSPEIIYNRFAQSWKVTDASARIFKDPPPSVDDAYEPIYTYADIPTDYDGAPSEATINNLCSQDTFCKWDYRLTGNRAVAQRTLKANELISYVQSSASRIDNCGLPEVGLMAQLTNYNFSVGQETTVSGCDHGKIFNGVAQYTCEMEPLSTARDKGRDSYGYRVTDEDTNQEFLVHWVPEPTTACYTETDTAENELYLIIGLVVAAVVLLIIAIIIGVVFWRRKAKSGSSNTRAPKEERVNRETEANESMIKSPMYKPRGDQVRTADSSEPRNYREDRRSRGSEV